MVLLALKLCKCRLWYKSPTVHSADTVFDFPILFYNDEGTGGFVFVLFCFFLNCILFFLDSLGPFVLAELLHECCLNKGFWGHLDNFIWLKCLNSFKIRTSSNRASDSLATSKTLKSFVCLNTSLLLPEVEKLLQKLKGVYSWYDLVLTNYLEVGDFITWVTIMGSESKLEHMNLISMLNSIRI